VLLASKAELMAEARFNGYPPEAKLSPTEPLQAANVSPFSEDEAQRRCRELLARLPPMEGSVKHERAWGIEESLEQFQCLMRQHELQAALGHSHTAVKKMQTRFCQLHAAKSLKSTSADEVRQATQKLRDALKLQAITARRAEEKIKTMEEEIKKSNTEMVSLRQAIEDVISGGGPPMAGPYGTGKALVGADRKWFYCSDCHVGGHGQRYCRYLLKRPNWRIYPSEKWFEDRHGQVSHCPLGKKAVDFTDETYFSRIAMHIKGRIWLEDKRKLYEFVPDLMPYTYVIQNRRWVGEVPPAPPADAPPWPWFIKETDRNWGTSVVCCSSPVECLEKAKDDATYVVQKHIPNPLLYYNGEKCHIKFYTLLVGLDDGVTWRLYTYKDGYLSISPKPWSPEDLSKECQVTIIRTKRINDWPYWEKVYPKCQAGVATVVKRAAEQGKLEGRNKIQFEIISADYIVTADEDVYLLEFNTGPVLKDPEDSPDVHDAGMVDGALHIVEPWEGGSPCLWDLALECKGVQPPPEEFNTMDT